MEIQILLIASALLAVYGGRITRQTEDECMQPPENTEMISCCEMPKKQVLGNIKETIHFCAQKMREKEGAPEISTMSPPPSGKKRHLFRQRFRDGCFVECIYEREGLLIDNKVDKQAVSEKIQESFKRHKEWQVTGMTAVEKCFSSEIVVAANETCKSGSSEILSCLHKEMYMNCPNWLADNEYCTAVKNFYMKCPNGPPPDVFPKRRNFHRNIPSAAEPEPEEDTESSDKDAE